MRRSSPIVLWIVDIFTCVASFAILVRHCLTRSPRKLFWTDEVLTLVMVRDTTLEQMFTSLKDTINAMPPTYFVCIWLWSQLFGTSEIALRLFSCVCVCLAWLLCWLLLRTFCSRLVAATATIVTIFSSGEVLFYNMEARCYSMYLAAYIAAGLFFVRSSRPSISVGIGIGAFLAHATLVSTHYVGILYSGALIVAAGFAWWITRMNGLRTYIVWSTLGAAMTVFTIPFYLAQRSLGGEDNWLVAPQAGALLSCYQYGLLNIHDYILLIAGIAGLKILLFDGFGKEQSLQQVPAIVDQELTVEATSRSLCVTIFCLVSGIFPVVIWVESQFGIRLFLARYLLPSFIIWPCLLGMYLQRLAQAKPGDKTGWSSGLCSVILCGAMITLALMVVVKHRGVQEGPRIEKMQQVAAAMKSLKLDFVTSDAHILFPVWHYGGHSVERLKYLRSTQRKGDRKNTERAEHRIVDALQRHFWSGIVLPPEELRSRRGRFLMLTQDRNDCLEDGTISSEFQVVEDLGEGLVIIER